MTLGEPGVWGARFVAKPCDFNDLVETIQSMGLGAPAGGANDR